MIIHIQVVRIHTVSYGHVLPFSFSAIMNDNALSLPPSSPLKYSCSRAWFKVNLFCGSHASNLLARSNASDSTFFPRTLHRSNWSSSRSITLYQGEPESVPFTGSLSFKHRILWSRPLRSIEGKPDRMEQMLRRTVSLNIGLDGRKRHPRCRSRISRPRCHESNLARSVRSGLSSSSSGADGGDSIVFSL